MNYTDVSLLQITLNRHKEEEEEEMIRWRVHHCACQDSVVSAGCSACA